MSAQPYDVEFATAEPSRLRQWLNAAWEFTRSKPLGAAGAFIVILMILAAVFANVIAPYNPVETDYGAMLAAPSASHWLGTDEFGRDLLSRIIYGARTALFVGFSAAFIGATVGLVIGVASAYFSGWLDLLIQRIVDGISLVRQILALRTATGRFDHSVRRQ